MLRNRERKVCFLLREQGRIGYWRTHETRKHAGCPQVPQVPPKFPPGYLVTSAVVNGAANVAGGEVQRSIDPSASGSAVTDFAAGAVGGAVGTKIAYARYPVPNVKKELAIIAQSNRRSLRPQRVADFNRYANQQTIRNNTAGSVAGTSVGNFISDLWSDLTSYVSRKKEKEPKACVTAAGQTTCDR